MTSALSSQNIFYCSAFSQRRRFGILRIKPIGAESTFEPAVAKSP